MEAQIKNLEVKQNNYKQIEKTPFTIAEIDNQWYLLIGNNLVYQNAFESELEIRKFIKKKSWNLITNVILTLFQKLNEYEKINQKNNLEKN